MGKHTIPAGTFFTYSPDISIECPSHQDEVVLEAIRWTDKQADKGGEMNCFTRARSDEERDGHLVRLLGAQKMHGLLLQLRGKVKVFTKYHGKAKPWCSPPDEHPCGMLSFNDKWWMWYWDEKNLSRFGHKKQEERSCVPEQLRKSSEHKYSVESCLYCNGNYDGTIQEALDLTTKWANTAGGPWTETMR